MSIARSACGTRCSSPGYLAEVLGSSNSWVSEDRMLFESTLDAPPDEPSTVWPRYLLASLLALALAWLSGRWLPATALSRAWFVLRGLAGLLILFFWFATDHLVAGLNMNILVFNPAWLVFVFWKRSWRMALPVVRSSYCPWPSPCFPASTRLMWWRHSCRSTSPQPGFYTAQARPRFPPTGRPGAPASKGRPSCPGCRTEIHRACTASG